MQFVLLPQTFVLLNIEQATHTLIKIKMSRCRTHMRAQISNRAALILCFLHMEANTGGIDFILYFSFFRLYVDII
jgi:hypothetical protein